MMPLEKNKAQNGMGSRMGMEQKHVKENAIVKDTT